MYVVCEVMDVFSKQSCQQMKPIGAQLPGELGTKGQTGIEKIRAPTKVPVEEVRGLF